MKRGRLIGVLVASAVIIPAGARAGVWGGAGSTSGTNCNCGPTTTRVSASSSGAETNGQAHWPSISKDGRFAAFASDATNLVPDTNGFSDLFVRDRVSNTTERVSISSAGAQANDASFQPDIASGGMHVAFGSWATNLTSDGGGGRQNSQVYVRNRGNNTTIRASKSSSGVSADGASLSPAISADGRYVAFDSSATNLVANDTNATDDIFRRDLVTGTTIRVSVTSTGTQGTSRVELPAISDDGRFIAFSADGALHPADTNGETDVYVWDANTGTTSPVSVDSTGRFRTADSFQATISGDGTKVAYTTQAPMLASDTNGKLDVYVRTLATGAIVRASLGAGGVQANGDSHGPSLSTTGDAVAFNSAASNLVAGDTNGWTDSFIRRVSGGTTDRVSLSSGGAQLNEPTWDNDIAGNGIVVAFQSTASNVVSPDTVRPAFPDEIYARTF